VAARVPYRSLRARCAGLLLLTLPSCAVVVDPAPDYDRVVEEVRSVTGAAGVHHPLAQEGVRERVEQLLGDGLAVHEAAEVGLLVNPGLQARIQAVGMGKANRVQAGLVSNPSFSAALRFPSGGGSSAIEASLFESLTDLWQRSAREGIAEAELQRLILDVAHEAALLAADIRDAYIDALAAARLLEVAEDNRSLVAQLVELAETRVAARAATAIDARLAEVERLGVEVAFRDARFEVASTRRRLVFLLGLTVEPTNLVLSGSLSGPSVALPDPGRLIDLALERRLDVRAARAHLEQAAEQLRLEHDLAVRVLDVGLVAEREDGWSIGPGVVIELPIFDGNEAQVARALAVLTQREKALAAVRLSATHEVVSSLARLRASQEAVALYTDGILPQTEATLEMARESYREGATALLPVVQAQRELLRARGALVLRLQAAASAMSELERATGATREELITMSQDERR
jgi:cobalt-zinc-cadmium efflux system outer membrane protein